MRHLLKDMWHLAGIVQRAENIYIFTNANNPRGCRRRMLNEKGCGGVRSREQGRGCRKHRSPALLPRGHRVKKGENKNVMLFEPLPHDEERCER